MLITATRTQSRQSRRSFLRTSNVPVLAFLIAVAGGTFALPSKALADSGARAAGVASHSPATVDAFMMIANIKLYELNP